MKSPFLLVETYIVPPHEIVRVPENLDRQIDDAELSSDHDYSGITPGAAIVAYVGMWLTEHWPAMAIGGAVGMLAIAIPAMILAPGF